MEPVQSADVGHDGVPLTSGQIRGSGLTSRRQLVWFVVVALAVVLIAFLKVPAYDYARNGLEPVSLTIAHIWWIGLKGLPDGGHDELLAVFFSGLIVAFLAGCAALLWYCLNPAVDQRSGTTPPLSEPPRTP